MLYNHEYLLRTIHPACVRKFSDYFFRLWKQLDNIGWQNAKQFHGYKVTDYKCIPKDISERICGFFLGNGNAPTAKWKISKEMERLGYAKEDIITVTRHLLDDGVLYEPKLDFVCMASA